MSFGGVWGTAPFCAVSKCCPKAELTDGNGDEKAALKKYLKANHLYIVDRGYVDYGLYQNILDAKGSFLVNGVNRDSAY